MKAVDKSWKILKTKSFKEIYAICQDAFSHSVMIGLTTLPGLGKTSTFQVFKEDHPNTQIITLDRNFGVQDLYVAMLHAVGIYDWTAYMKPKAMAEKFAYTIQQMKEPYLFIFDEAGLFEKPMLLYFHTIFDSCKGKLGMVLAGTPVFKENMDKWKVRSNNSGIPELDSRFLYWGEVTSCSRTERMEVARHNGINDDYLAKDIANETSSFRAVYNRVIEYRISLLQGKQLPNQAPKTKTTSKSKLQEVELV